MKTAIIGTEGSDCIVHLHVYAGDHGPRNTLQCLLQHVGTQERDPAFTFVTSSPGFLCPLM